MPAHPDFAAAFRAAVFAGGMAPGTTARDPSEAPRRFAVYRNNVLHGLTEALRARFPVVERLVGAEFFAAMARVFIGAHPPENPVLLAWGAAFPGFLEGFPPVAGLPYLPDVARLELARGRAYHAADAAPIDPGRLASAADPGALRIGLHPSVTLFASDHPAVSIWRANQPGQARRIAAPGPEAALIARRPDLEVVVEPLSPAELAMIDALSRRHPLAEASLGTDPAPALALLLRHGLVTDILTGETP